MNGLTAADLLAAERLALPATTRTARLPGGWRLSTADAPWFGDGNIDHLDAPPAGRPAHAASWATLGDAAAGPVEPSQTLAVLALDVLRASALPEDHRLVITPVADAADVRDVAAVFAHFAWPDAPDGYWTWRAERFHELDTGTLWLARLDGRPVAAAGLFTDGRLAVVQDVVVDVSLRGRGVGATLMTAIVAAHRAVHPSTHLLLQVDPASPAEGFYERLGFHRVGSAHTMRVTAGTA